MKVSLSDSEYNLELVACPHNTMSMDLSLLNDPRVFLGVKQWDEYIKLLLLGENFKFKAALT